MPGRNYVGANSYRYGMNGQEMDNEVDGQGNTMTAEYWEYDGRIGRRWNMDPKPTTASESPYLCFSNSPIRYDDPDGDIVRYSNIKTFFKVIGHAIKDKNFRKQLIAQMRDKRGSIQKDLSGNEFEEKPQDQIYRYSYNENSVLSLDQAANNLDQQRDNKVKENQHASANDYHVSFSTIKTEKIYKFGASVGEDAGPTGEGSAVNPKRGPIIFLTKQSFKEGTITVHGGANDDTGNDKVEIFQDGTGKLLYSGSLPYNSKNEINLKFLNKTESFNATRRGRLRVVISSESGIVRNPGGYVTKITIIGK